MSGDDGGDGDGDDDDDDEWQKCMQYLRREQGLNAMWRLCNSVIQTRRRRDELHALGPHIAKNKTGCFTIEFLIETNLLVFCYAYVTTFVEIKMDGGE
jgi:hypothetical protein